MKATDEAYIVKNPAAVALGRLGGLKGGRVRVEAYKGKKGGDNWEGGTS